MILATIALFADADQMTFIQILERLGAFGLLAILIGWYIYWGHPRLVEQFRESLKQIGDSHLSAVTKVVDEHAREQESCHKERISNAQIARDVAKDAAMERDKDRDVRLQLAGTLIGINETLKKLNKE